MNETNKFWTVLEKKTDRLFSKRLIYKISLFVLLLIQVSLSLNALTDWDQADFLFATQSKKMLSLLVISSTVILAGLWTSWKHFIEKANKKLIKILVAGMFLAALFLQLYFLFHVRSLYLFDNAFVTGGASTLALGEGVAKEANYYFSVYPNQNAFIILTAVLWKLGKFLGFSRGQIPFLLNIVNMICLDVAFYLLYLTFVAARPNRTFCQKVLMITAILTNPFLYIGVCYYYTITLSMPFFMALIYLYIRLILKQERTAVRGYLFMGVLFAVGYLMRATTVIPMLAMICVWLYFGPRKKEMLLVILSGVICISLIGKMNTAQIGLDTEDTAFPAMHWVMMSMTSPGSHNAEDETYTAGFATKEEKQAAVRVRLEEKLHAMSGKDMTELLWEKLKNTWGDGSNGYTVYLENCVNTDGVYEAVFGQHKDGVILYHQVYYVFLMLLFVKNICVSLKKRDSVAYVWQLTYLGGVLFYLLWETSGQYSIPFMPLLMLGAVDSFADGDEVTTTDYHTAEMNIAADNQMAAGNMADKRYGCLAYLWYAIYACCVIFLVAFFVRKYPVFTKQTWEFEHPVVRQILANDEIRVGRNDTFIQSFTTDQSFNQIIFQYTNANEETDAVYEVKLMDSERHVWHVEEISLAGAPYRNAAVISLDNIDAGEKKNYQLVITQKTGGKQDEIGLISYSMGYYDALPTGDCILNDEMLNQDLLLAVSDHEVKTYMTKSQYMGGLFVCGLIVFLPILEFLVYTIKYMAFFTKTGKS